MDRAHGRDVEVRILSPHPLNQGLTTVSCGRILFVAQFVDIFSTKAT